METTGIHNYSPKTVPNVWVMPGLEATKGSVDAFELIIKMVCKRYDLERDVVMSKSRKREHVKARQIMMSLLRTNFYKLSASHIGDMIGGKDHATVLHGCTSVANQCETDSDYREEYEEMDLVITSNLKQFIQTHLKLKNRQYV